MSDLQPKTILIDRIKFFMLASLNVWTKFKFAHRYALAPTKFVQVVSASLRSKDETNPEVPLARAVFEITCNEVVLNPSGHMHGGSVATYFDNLTTYAMAALDVYWDEFDPSKQSLQAYTKTFVSKIEPDIGVSRSLQVTFHRPVVEGQKVFLSVDIISDSKRFITYTAKIYDSKGKIYSVATHDKVKSRL